MTVRFALHLQPNEEEMQFARELGLTDVVSDLPPGTTGCLEYDDLCRQRDAFAAGGLCWDVIENLPPIQYQKVMFGLSGREEQIENVRRTIRNVGRAGISVLQYHWMLLGGLRTEYSPTGRGGARVSRFDLAAANRFPAAVMDWRGSTSMDVHLPDREIGDDEVWANLKHFLEGVVPAAEESGVRLACHPDDPPVASFLGVARVVISPENLQRLIDLVPSPSSGLGFCQGTVQEMAGVGPRVVDLIRRFGEQGRIFFAHFRNCKGTMPSFDEVFFDDGDADMVAAMAAYEEVGFDGVIRADHSPGLIGDSPRAHRSFAYQIGYMQGLAEAISAARGGQSR